MIPTTLTNSSSTPVTGVVNPINTLNSSGSSSTSSNAISNVGGLPNHVSALLGIASLILEGRGFVEDEYPIQTTLRGELPLLSGNSMETGRQSPKPSTSRAAYGDLMSGANEMNAYLLRKMNTSPDSTLYIDSYSSSSGSASSSFDSQQSRWSQKLSQLRQESPSSNVQIIRSEQKVTVEGIRHASEPEYVALAIKTETGENGEREADFEIIRRIALNRINMYNSPNSISGSGNSSSVGGANIGFGNENFMSSLQSLATNTCLRVGSPFFQSSSGPSTPKYSFRALSGSSNNSPRFPSPQLADLSTGSGGSTGSAVQSPKSLLWLRNISSASNVAVSTPTTARAAVPLLSTSVASKLDISSATSSVNVTNRSQAPQQGPHCDQFLRKMGLMKNDSCETEEHSCDKSYVNITCTRWRAHCLKMEAILARGEAICIEVYLGPVGHKILLEQWIINLKEKQPPPTMTLPSLCSAIRSQLYFSQVSAWCDLIKKSDKSINETGRLILTTPLTSAAGDLATLTGNASPSTALTATAVSVATTLSSSPLSASVGCSQRRPRLNILYRIKQYDSTACFNSKPNVHNFPNVNISENCCVSVCLKSLPRFAGGIPPRVGNTLPVTTQILSASGTMATTITTTTTKNHLPALNNLTVNCDNNAKQCWQQEQQQLKAATKMISMSTNQKERKTVNFVTTGNDGNDDDDGNCSDNNVTKNSSAKIVQSNCYDIVNVDDGSNSSFSTNNANLSHREKQLLKYRKRMFKRDKKQRKRGENYCVNNNNASTINLKEPSNEDELPQLMDEEGGEEEDGDDEDDGQEDRSCHKDLIKKFYTPSLSTIEIRQTKERNSIPTNESLHQVKMISTGTQTSQTLNCCSFCGGKRTLVCLKCNYITNKNSRNNLSTSSGASVQQRRRSNKSNFCSPKDSSDLEMDDLEAEAEHDSSASSLSSNDIIRTPRNKAELLLQAIQRTPKTAKKHRKTKENSNDAVQKNHSNNSTANVATLNESCVGAIAPTSNTISCQMCKRQKTQHNFNQPTQMMTEQPPTAGTTEDISSDECLLSSTNTRTTTTTTTTASNDNKNKNDETAIEKADQQINGTRIVGKESEDVNIQNNDATHVATVPAVDININEIRRTEIMEEVGSKEYFESSTKLTPYIERCSLKSRHQQNHTSQQQQQKNLHNCSTPPLLNEDLNANAKGDGIANDIARESNRIMAQFKTPTDCQKSSKASCKHTSKPQQLKIVCNFDNIGPDFGDGDGSNKMQTDASTPSSSRTLISKANLTSNRRNLLKVNLTPIFCNTAASLMVSMDNQSSNAICPSIPIVQNGAKQKTKDGSNSAEVRAETSLTFSFESPTTSALHTVPTVQKSNSAPTLPNSPSLSPRFFKASTIYKRRSRHLSDRSDRSSFGSDEQYSDEDNECNLYSPLVISPIKSRNRLTSVFARKSLLGNLEENLLQRRLMPKIEVVGFRLLLGASGGFCPTQLTIPAAAYFYELHGETLSTPYLCEVRLPRKGYTVPRFGTVQATLLNPMGTVVRMFVIPYDMRDMPALHQTFVRQRILADGGQMSDMCMEHVQHNGVVDCSNNKCNKTVTINAELLQQQQEKQTQQPRTPNTRNESNLGHFISTEHMKSLRYSIHLRFQTSRSGRLMLHTDIRLLISRRTDCDTAAAHAKGIIEGPNDFVTDTVMPANPKYSARHDQQTSSKI
uniref:DUF4210 domain-containing protein n=1 Tax=Glossina brevipalpis TaxID=37001 RepID=A0A1A9WQQ3_9MUSC